MSETKHTPNLTQRAPRSVRTRLGGYSLLPRMLDKGRATIAGTNGDYHYDCPLDQQILSFLGIDAAALSEQLTEGKGDGEILEWITANAKNARTAWEIQQWSDFQDRRTPSSDPDTAGFFAGLLGKITTNRSDIQTWADLLDLDDHVSFGGQA